MSVYYNENDPFAAAWLRELMRDGLIAPGWVDERSIEDVLPLELQGFTQCHFFAGIGVWSLALRVAGWPDDRPIWTGSCPCQPFSAAGKGAGFADERHLWPAWYHLIEHGKRRDVVVVGEQVASKDGRTWFDLVSGDMQALDHTCGAVDTSAASLGAPFIGQRLYWLATSASGRNIGQCNAGKLSVSVGAGQIDRLAASEHDGSHRAVGPQTEQDRNEPHERLPVGDHTASRMATSTSGQPRHGHLQSSGQHGLVTQDASHSDGSGIPLHPVDYWRDADWLLCRDPNGARFRPVESGTFPLAHGGAVRNRLAAVRGAGNALNISQAACFIEAVMEHLNGR